MKKISASHSRIVKVVLSALVITIVHPLWADSASDDAIQQRSTLMKEMKDHMKSIKKILDGDAGILSEHTSGIARLTKTLETDLKSLFPIGSNQGDSQANEIVWKNWDEFAKVAQSAATKGADLLQATDESSSNMIAAYKEMGQICKDCHKDYRTEK